VDHRAQADTDEERWRFDDRFSLSIVLSATVEGMHDALPTMTKNDVDKITLFKCREGNDIVPQPFQVFAKDGIFQ
jgi:hypothetical protein